MCDSVVLVHSHSAAAEGVNVEITPSQLGHTCPVTRPPKCKRTVPAARTRLKNHFGRLMMSSRQHLDRGKQGCSPVKQATFGSRQAGLLTSQDIWNGQLGDGWRMSQSIGVVMPPAPAQGNLLDLCVTFPGRGTLSFSYGAQPLDKNNGPDVSIAHWTLCRHPPSAVLSAYVVCTFVIATLLLSTGVKLTYPGVLFAVTLLCARRPHYRICAPRYSPKI